MSTPDVESARLVRDGQRIEPEELFAHTAPVDERRLAATCELARRSGRIFEHEGLQIWALGEAARIELPSGLCLKDAPREAARLLRAIPDGGTPPVALGALPFDSRQSAAFVIPAVSAVVRSGAPAVAVVVGDPEEIAGHLGRFPFSPTNPPELEREIPPDAFELASVRSHADYRDRVTAAVAAIGRGEIDKVVLAREIAVRANRPFALGELIGRLRQLHPGCATFSIDGFLGASPELLVRRERQKTISRPLAGTVARSGDPEEDVRLAAGLLKSSKELREHAFVVDAIVAALSEFTSTPIGVAGPRLLELRNVVHLASTVEARIGPTVGVLELVAALHPTPAVAGEPRDSALAYLAQHEAIDRDRYAGAVGWCDASGDGEFYVGIRSAMIDGESARLISGSGIVEGSDPDGELAETQLKLQAFLAAAVRP